MIDPGLLSSEFDLFAMRSAVESAMRFVSAPVWKDFILGPAQGLENVTTDAQLNTYIQSHTGSTCHLVGTAAMSAKGANFGVVDPDLRVKGVAGLRIVDASIFVSHI
ncbi:MAG TPA: GMC family oxidoreductase [Chlamydiales bacterium]|nr:GMC family oxidoreductase [Chlamydiales bacterium]